MNSNASLKCAVIGVGRMGRHHARIYSELPGVDFLGVLDSNSERAQDAVETHGGRAFGSIGELIDSGVDAVFESVLAPGVRAICMLQPTRAPLARSHW